MSNDCFATFEQVFNTFGQDNETKALYNMVTMKRICGILYEDKKSGIENKRQ